METRKLLGFGGSILLFIGVFMPVVSAPIWGNMNYFQNGKGDGVFIILLSIVSFYFTFSSDYKKLRFTGIGSLGVLAFTYINLQRKLSELQSSINTELSGNPFKGLADMAIQSIQIQWGWGCWLSLH
jgi:hypothetical protein